LKKSVAIVTENEFTRMEKKGGVVFVKELRGFCKTNPVRFFLYYKTGIACINKKDFMAIKSFLLILYLFARPGCLI
jgi:hypothetical protein